MGVLVYEKNFSGNSCNFRFVFVPYMRAKKQFKKFGNDFRIEKSNFASVATLAVLATTQNNKIYRKGTNRNGQRKYKNIGSKSVKQ